MIQTISRLVSQRVSRRCENVIEWSSPVPAFGMVERSAVASLGINPSDKEFLDSTGSELTGRSRRLHTLNSLGIPDWTAAKESHVELVATACETYFLRQPYDRWFKVLDHVLESTGTSFYS